MIRDQIFVCYSHRDKRWLDELRITLKPLLRKRKIEIWDDTKISIGGKWRSEIEAALKKAQIAVLLVSRNFLNSDFIAENELPPFLKAAEAEGLLVIFWIAVGHSSYEQTEIVNYQAANDPSRPLNCLTECEIDFELVKISKAIDGVLEGGPRGTETERVVQSDLISPDLGVELPDEADTTVAQSDLTGADTSVELETEGAAKERIRQTLAEGQWAWRSLSALASKAALDLDPTLRILRADPEIELGRSKTGKIIARLRTRVS